MGQPPPRQLDHNWAAINPSVIELDDLALPFSIDEIKSAIWDMSSDKAPWPDGLPTGFYQNIWEVLIGQKMELFVRVQIGELPLFNKLNFRVIKLLPKKENMVQIQQYRSICLLNVS